MLQELLPAAVSVSEVFGDQPSEGAESRWSPSDAGPALFPEEEAVVSQSVEKRRREFTAGRRCAHRALGDLGCAPAPLLPGPRGAPRWPAGVVGAITHCEGYAAAAVARGTDVLALGVDAEPAGALPDGILEAVALPGERTGLDACRRHAPQVPWDRLLFSAKEAVYKAWYPLTARPLEFEDAHITFHADRGTFTARLLVPGWRLGEDVLTGFEGRWAAHPALVMTAVALPAQPVVDHQHVDHQHRARLCPVEEVR